MITPKGINRTVLKDLWSPLVEGDAVSNYNHGCNDQEGCDKSNDDIDSESMLNILRLC